MSRQPDARLASSTAITGSTSGASCYRRSREVVGPGRVVASVVAEHGVEYTGTRGANEAPCIRDAKGDVVNVSLDGPLFLVDFCAQKELESIADDPVTQLALIDSTAPRRSEGAPTLRVLRDEAKATRQSRSPRQPGVPPQVVRLVPA